MSDYREYYVALEFGVYPRAGVGERKYLARNVVNIAGSPPTNRRELNVLVEKAIEELGAWAKRSILWPPDAEFSREIDAMLESGEKLP